MTSRRVVPAFDELEDRHARLGLGHETPARKKLAFQSREEALAHGVVVGVAHRSHGRPDLGFFAAKPEGDGVARKPATRRPAAKKAEGEGGAAAAPAADKPTTTVKRARKPASKDAAAPAPAEGGDEGKKE